MSITYKQLIENLKSLDHQPRIQINKKTMSIDEWAETINNLEEEIITPAIILVR